MYPPIINKINEQDCRYTSLFKNIDKNSIIKNTIIFIKIVYFINFFLFVSKDIISPAKDFINYDVSNNIFVNTILN